MMLRLQVATFATSYYQGETFLAAIEREGGAKAIEQAFRDPPTETAVIFEPTWFLHPESRPKEAFDLEIALQAIAEEYPEPDRASQRGSITPIQLDVALQLLPEETVGRIKKSLVQNHVLMVYDASMQTQEQAIIGLLEFDSPAEALHYVEAGRRLQKLKDEAMKEGQIKIVEATYEDLDEAPGFLAWKRIEVAGIDIEAQAVFLARGPLVAEIVFSDMGLEPEEARAVAIRVLDGARKIVPPETTPERGTEGDDNGAEGSGGGQEGLPGPTPVRSWRGGIEWPKEGLGAKPRPYQRVPRATALAAAGRDRTCAKNIPIPASD